MGWIEDNTNIDPIAKVGMRIRMINMDDDTSAIDEGMEGTIMTIDDLGTLHVKWDDGSQLGVIPTVDEYELLPSLDQQIGLDVFGESSDFKVSRAAKSNKMGKQVAKNFKRELSNTSPKVTGIKVESEEIEGGEAEKMSVQDLAKKHGVKSSDIEKELEVGTKIELEHTDSKKMAKEIAMDHISEFPDYYTNKKYGVKASEKGLEKIHENKTTIKDEVKRILDTIKTAKPIHRSSLDNMVTNLFNKYKNVKKDEEKFTELIQKLRDKISDKFDIDETTMAASSGAYVGPTTKKIQETTTTKNTDYTSGIDDKFWADKNKDGWNWNDKPLWKGGEIVDLLAKISATWNDSNLDISKEWDKSKKTYISEVKDKTIHTKKWDRCVKDVEKKNKENNTDYNPHAVCTDSIGYEGSIKKSHRKKDIEETTTFSSVFGGNFPVTPYAFAKKGKHNPSKKTLWKGGKIIQKVDRSDLLGESKILDEINKVKWVKGGKYVKIKDKCAKYNNQPHCSQGSIDNPLELSDSTFENIKNISKKNGLSEEYIIEKIITELSSR
jgi:hypothetical protein